MTVTKWKECPGDKGRQDGDDLREESSKGTAYLTNNICMLQEKQMGKTYVVFPRDFLLRSLYASLENLIYDYRIYFLHALIEERF